jgi:hypothetical protein
VVEGSRRQAAVAGEREKDPARVKKARKMEKRCFFDETNLVI